MDPADVGSWAILLHDLAVACGLDVTGATGFAWWRNDDEGWGWRLDVVKPLGGCKVDLPNDIHPDDVGPYDDDPARALVLARIDAREREGR